MPESKYWIKPASWRLTDLVCRPARSDSSRLRCSRAISRLPSRSSTKSYCRGEQREAWHTAVLILIARAFLVTWVQASEPTSHTGWRKTSAEINLQSPLPPDLQVSADFPRSLHVHGLTVIPITNHLFGFLFISMLRIKLSAQSPFQTVWSSERRRGRALLPLPLAEAQKRKRKA